MYTKTLTFKSASLSEGIVIEVPAYHRLQLDPEHPSYHDAEMMFSQRRYQYPYLPLYLGRYVLPEVENIDVNVLRVLIRLNDHQAPVYLPKELLMFQELILQNINYHRQYYPANKDAFVHVTIRSCPYEAMYYKNSQTWHVDGFQGSRVDRHLVEQDILWSNVSPTEFLLQPMFCANLDPSRFDINAFFEAQHDPRYVVQTHPNAVYLATPYNIHRVQVKPYEGQRVFFRLTFSPVEIEDPTNTVNPMLKRSYAARQDVRDFLEPYPIDESPGSGFMFC